MLANKYGLLIHSYCPPGKKTNHPQGRCCVFPFIYAGKKYYSCTTSSARHPWCSFDEYHTWNWAYCVDECASSPCKNGASCRATNDSEIGYSCQPCPEGWIGENCDKVDECARKPCKNAANCKITEDGYSCQPCPAGWKGKDCDEVHSYCPPGKKTNDPQGRCCVFPFIYAGKKYYSCTTSSARHPWCSFDEYHTWNWAYCVDECASSPCKNGASCRVTNDSEVGYSCQPCPEGWRGENCDKVDECVRSPCKNGANCKITEDGYSCQPCPAGWKGKDCDEDIDECKSAPCKNGGICENDKGTFTCKCNASFTGHLCEKDIDECKSPFPCKNNGTCVNEHGSYTCNCNAGFTGKLCEKDIDECKSAPCKNGGICENDKGTFTCKCNASFTGHLCEKDIDECKSPSPCKNNGTCVNEHGSYTCNCNAGFTGNLCEKDIDECKSAPCKNRGICDNDNGSFTCKCNAGFAGHLCEKDIDECKSPSPCKNNGNCVNEHGSYTCNCNAGFTGKLCEKVDECSRSLCKNGANCKITEDGYSCQPCPAGWKGKDCDEVVSVGSPEEPSEEPTPEGITYKPVGCFRDGPLHARAMPELLINFRGNIDWNHLEKLVEKCADEAMRRGKKYFGLHFYGECRSVKNSGHNYDRYGKNPSGCYKNLVGKEWNNMVYKFE
ncbi:fibropellin-1-like isoform X3 [Montipora capricornis]|uniref:fibropellin-1-like isoform X3 n=1 Tax=Montipora capricornis TaxID=246305 RepID=UPI0035F12047